MVTRSAWVVAAVASMLAKGVTVTKLENVLLSTTLNGCTGLLRLYFTDCVHGRKQRPRRTTLVQQNKLICCCAAVLLPALCGGRGGGEECGQGVLFVVWGPVPLQNDSCTYTF